MVMIHIEKEFNYKGYECAIKKIDYTNENMDESFFSSEDFSGRKWWLSGYIFLPNFKVELKDEINNIMHGGITYEDLRKGFGITPDLTVLGFDCNHRRDTNEHNTIEYVENNLKEVIDFIEEKLEGEIDVKNEDPNN